MKFQKLSVALGYYSVLLNGRRFFNFSDKRYCNLVHALALSVGYLGDCFPAQRKLAALLIDKINNKVNVCQNNETMRKFIDELNAIKQYTEGEGYTPTLIVGFALLRQFDCICKDGMCGTKMNGDPVTYLFDPPQLANKFDDFVKTSPQLKDTLAELNKWYPILLNERSN